MDSDARINYLFVGRVKSLAPNGVLTWSHPSQIWLYNEQHAISSIDGFTIKTGGQSEFLLGNYNGHIQGVFIPRTLVGATMTKIHARAFQNNYLKRIDLRAFNDNPIVKVTIGTGVFIESHRAFPGEPEDAFKQAYEAHGAGTYIFEAVS